MTDAPNDPESTTGAFGSRATVAADTPTAQAPAAAGDAQPTPTPRVPQQLARTAVKQTHVVRGVLWGFLFGLGLTLVAIVTKVIALSLVPAVIVLVLGITIGTLWSLFGPAKPLPG